MSKKATTEMLPTHIEEVEALRYEKIALQINMLDMQKQVLQAQMQAIVDGLNTKYKLTEKDQIDLSTRAIKRAEPAAEAAAK